MCLPLVGCFRLPPMPSMPWCVCSPQRISCVGVPTVQRIWRRRGRRAGSGRQRLLSRSERRFAGRYADGFALRGYDSIQLAAAQQLQSTIEQPLTFACFDRRLNQAAQLLQLQVLS